jgi:hypothetical protein
MSGPFPFLPVYYNAENSVSYPFAYKLFYVFYCTTWQVRRKVKLMRGHKRKRKATDLEKKKNS